MSTRKYLRARVRHMAEETGLKPSAAVHRWRYFLDAYPRFHGAKRQKNGKQFTPKYPVPKNQRTTPRTALQTRSRIRPIRRKELMWDKMEREARATRRAKAEGRA